jgi:hypothetical protein
MATLHVRNVPDDLYAQPLPSLQTCNQPTYAVRLRHL